MNDIELEELPFELRMAYLDLRCEIAAQRFILACHRMMLLLRKAGFSPDQPRDDHGRWTDTGAADATGDGALVSDPSSDPAGSAQWTDGTGSEDGNIILAGARGRGSVMVQIGGQVVDATPAQAARLAIAEASASASLQRVQEVDPTWRPQPGLNAPGSVEGAIAGAQARAQEAEARFSELARGRFGDNQGPPLDAVLPRAGTGTPSVSPYDAMESFRAITRMPELPSGVASRRTDGTVAYTELDGRPIFGVNSNAPGYTVSDELAARAMRARLVGSYPDIMRQENLGWMPNDALFHAEANALMRAVDANGGSLAGRYLNVRVDRLLCESCDQVLPLIGLQLGNPTVRLVDGNGDVWIMRNGNWLRRGRQ